MTNCRSFPDIGPRGGSLNTPDERCSSDALVMFGCQVRWGSFFRPSPFWPLDDFFWFLFLLILGSMAPNYSRRPLMRSSKAPPNQKIRGKFYPTPLNLASEPDKCNARRGYLGTSGPRHHCTRRSMPLPLTPTPQSSQRRARLVASSSSTCLIAILLRRKIPHVHNFPEIV